MATLNTRLTRIRSRLEETTANVHDDDVIMDDYNQSCRRVVEATDHRDFQAEHGFNSVAGTRKYTLPTDYREILALYRGTTKLTRMRLDEMEGISVNGTGTPSHYVTIGGSLALWAVPSAAASMHLKYRTWPTAMTATGDTVPVPDYMLSACEAYVLARQYEQIGDWDTAALNWDIHDREVQQIVNQQRSEKNSDTFRMPKRAW